MGWRRPRQRAMKGRPREDRSSEEAPDPAEKIKAGFLEEEMPKSRPKG